MSFASASIAWINANPALFVFYFWVVGSIVTGLLRKYLPGTRWVAVVSGIFIDLVKIACAIFKIPLPGGFSPAPAVIPATTEAVAKMPEPVESGGPKDPPKPGVGTQIKGLGGPALMVVVIAIGLGGCAWLTSPKVVQDRTERVVTQVSP